MFAEPFLLQVPLLAPEPLRSKHCPPDAAACVLWSTGNKNGSESVSSTLVVVQRRTSCDRGVAVPSPRPRGPEASFKTREYIWCFVLLGFSGGRMNPRLCCPLSESNPETSYFYMLTVSRCNHFRSLRGKEGDDFPSPGSGVILHEAAAVQIGRSLCACEFLCKVELLRAPRISPPAPAPAATTAGSV